MAKIGEYTCCQILVDLMVCNQLLFELSNFSVRILVDWIQPGTVNSYGTERLICGSRSSLDNLMSLSYCDGKTKIIGINECLTSTSYTLNGNQKWILNSENFYYSFLICIKNRTPNSLRMFVYTQRSSIIIPRRSSIKRALGQGYLRSHLSFHNAGFMI